MHVLKLVFTFYTCTTRFFNFSWNSWEYIHQAAWWGAHIRTVWGQNDSPEFGLRDLQLLWSLQICGVRSWTFLLYTFQYNHLSCHLTPDTNIVKWRINKLTNKKHISVHTLPCCSYTPIHTYTNSVHNWHLWVTWYCILSADFTVGTRELGSCMGSLYNRQIGQLSSVWIKLGAKLQGKYESKILLYL
jgi:hypothetical protein